MKVFIIFVLFCIIAHPASAQDMLRAHRQNDPTAKILNPDQKQPQSLTDYSNLYYDSCTQSNTDESLNEYVQTQCACTAIKLAEFMTVNDMKVLFTKSKEGDFQQARILMLAYIPCMESSIHDFVFDNCFYDNNTRKQLQNERKVCECYASGAGNYVAKHGQNWVPGFNREGFNSDKSVPNPLAYIIRGDFFSRDTKQFFDRCVRTEEPH